MIGRATWGDVDVVLIHTGEDDDLVRLRVRGWGDGCNSE